MGVSSGGQIVGKTPFFYGWVIVAAGSLGLIMSSPGQTYTISIFIDHFIMDLGISRGTVSTLYTVGSLTASLGLPYIGKTIDVRGPRLMIGVISVILGVTCFYMGMIQAGWMLLIGFVLLRLLGQGSMSLISTYVINQWWVRKRGAILGISGVAAAIFGMGSFPNLVNWMIPLVGWRWVYAILGLALILIMAPIGLLFYRSRPEFFGLEPDNAAEKEEQQADDTPIEVNWTLQEVRKTSTFWIIAAGMATISMLATGLTFHMVSIFADNNMSSSVAAAVYVPIAFTAAAANLGSGVLVDRFPVRYILAISLLLQTIALWMAPNLSNVPAAILFGVALGTMFGLQRTVSTTVWPTYFGRLYLGSVAGFAATLNLAASAMGSMPLGYARDWFGSYNATLYVLSILPLTIAFISLFLKPPVKNPATPDPAAP